MLALFRRRRLVNGRVASRLRRRGGGALGMVLDELGHGFIDSLGLASFDGKAQVDVVIVRGIFDTFEGNHVV